MCYYSWLYHFIFRFQLVRSNLPDTRVRLLRSIRSRLDPDAFVAFDYAFMLKLTCERPMQVTVPWPAI